MTIDVLTGIIATLADCAKRYGLDVLAAADMIGEDVADGGEYPFTLADLQLVHDALIAAHRVSNR